MNSKQAKERLYGIDLLRILAIYMVCIVHSNTYGNAHTDLHLGYETFFYFSTWTESIALIGVNLFAMITGYVCLHSKWNLKRYINLWLTVVFYSILLLLIGIVLTKIEVLNWAYSSQEVFNIITSLPFGSTYWYFAAYSALFFCIPFLNAALIKCSKVQFIYLLFLLFTIIPFFNLKSSETFISGGHNFTWLAFLYVGGAYIKRFQPRFNSITLVVVILLCSILPLTCRLIGIPAPFGYCYHNFILYTFCTFLLLYQINIKNKKLQKIILFASQISFAVYLIHQHPTGEKLHAGTVHYILSSLDYPLWFAFAVATCVYLSCVPIEYIRIKLFQILKLQTLSECIARYIEKIFKLIMRKINQ